ncbi:uncharacterized protein LOC124484256 [Hypomesus transpacificus]|uniref:uncharacterized protein LOC124484256 n=1 Tax=Hypomesus transpacificus TaxID=137520 RepID=UPI001F072E74|nr:uncharacterized protein LOC124484256 [Hypomesus transpacificus]
MDLDNVKCIINAPQFHISDKPSEIPQLSLSIAGKRIPFLVDTGATMSCLRKTDFDCPMSKNTVQSVGISGKPQIDPVSLPLQIDFDDYKLQHSFIVSATSPMALLGRDLLSKLNATILCSQDGIEVHIPPNNAYQLFSGCVQTNHIAKSVLEQVEFIKTLSTISGIKKLASCNVAARIVNLKPIDFPFSDKLIDPDTLQEVPRNIFISPHGILLLWKTTSGNIETFVCAVRNDFSDVPHFNDSCTQYLLKSPDQEETHKSCVIWTYGVEPTHFFIKDLQTDVKPQIRNHGNIKLSLCAPCMLREVPSTLWALHANHVGLLDVPPYEAMVNMSKYPVYIKQYPLSKEKEGIKPVIDSLLQQGVICKAQSPNNTPINPILKPGTNKYRFTQDLRKINEAVIPISPIVPDINSILTALPADSKWYTVVDLSSAYFSIPIHKNTQPLFAFTFQQQQYIWTRLPMGYVDSAVVYSAMVNRHLAQCPFLVTQPYCNMWTTFWWRPEMRQNVSQIR